MSGPWFDWLSGLVQLGGLLALVELGLVMLRGSGGPSAGEDYGA